MIRPHNPLILLLDDNGVPIPYARVRFFQRGTDVPASVAYESGSLTDTIEADDSGFFPSVTLGETQYTLRSYRPVNEAGVPSWPEDFEEYQTWNIDGPEPPVEDETPIFVDTKNALRALAVDEHSRAVLNGVNYVLRNKPVGANDDDGFLLVSTDDATKAWVAVVEGDLLPVTLFGADPNGIEDSSSAIASAIYAAANYAVLGLGVPCPSIVHVPNGTYSVSEDANFTTPVQFDQSASFVNTTDHALTFTFYNRYDLQSNGPPVLGAGVIDFVYSLSVPHYIDGRISSGSVNGANVGGLASVYAGELTRNAGDTDYIARLVVPASGVSISSSGAGTLTIADIDASSGGKIDLTYVTGKVFFGCEVKTSQLANPWPDILKVSAPRLVVDSTISLEANASLAVGEIAVTPNGVVKNETAAPFVFSCNGPVRVEGGKIYAAHVVYNSPISAKDLDWTGADASDILTFVAAHGLDADFEGVTIATNATISASVTLRRLNLTGDLTMNNAAVELRECNISGDVSAWTARIFDSSIGGSLKGVVDVEATGSRFLFVSPRVGQVDDPTPRQGLSFKFYRCNISDSFLWGSVHPLRNLVIRECSVDNACFFKKLVGGVWTQTYGVPVEDWDAAENVNIDISDNTTADNTSGKPLLRSKGFATLDGAEQDGDGLYLTRLGSKGIIDFLNAAGTESRIGDAIFSPFAVGNFYSTSPSAIPNGTPYEKDSGNYAAVRRTTSSDMVAMLDPWNTQKKW